MKHILSILLVFILVDIDTQAAPKAILHDEEVTSLEKRFFNDLSDGVLNKFSLYDAFLIASQIKDESPFQRYKSDLLGLRRLILQSVPKSNDPSVTGQRLLTALHKHALHKYYLQSFAFNLLANGEFNCLTSAVLYGMLAGDLGLKVKGVFTDNHAYCILETPTGPKIIQTTVPYGFDPSEEQIKQMNKFTGYDVNGAPGTKRIVSILQLMGGLYANRIALLEYTSGTTAEDLSKYKKAFYFDSESDYLSHNIMACFNNLSLNAVKEGDYSTAAQYLSEANSFSSGKSFFAANIRNAFLFKAKYLLEMREFEKVEEICRFGNEAFQPDTAFKYIQTLSQLDQYYNRALQSLDNHDYPRALEYCSQGLMRLPDNKLLKNLKDSLLLIQQEASESRLND
jgi:tetratricopeptide (TPR) repeat protein